EDCVIGDLSLSPELRRTVEVRNAIAIGWSAAITNSDLGVRVNDLTVIGYVDDLRGRSIAVYLPYFPVAVAKSWHGASGGECYSKNGNSEFGHGDLRKCPPADKLRPRGQGSGN